MSRKPSLPLIFNNPINPINPINSTNSTIPSNPNNATKTKNTNKFPTNTENPTSSSRNGTKQGVKRQLPSAEKIPTNNKSSPLNPNTSLTAQKKQTINHQDINELDNSSNSKRHSEDLALSEKRNKKEYPLDATDQDCDENMSDNEEETNTSALAMQLEANLGHVPNQTDDWITAQSRLKKDSGQRAKALNPTNSNMTKLPAIKFFISLRAVEAFKSPVAIAKEIEKCMGTNLKIKFASLKGNLLIIATDDKVSHQKLQEIWPDNAFMFGLKPINKQNEDIPRPVIIHGVDPSVDMNDVYVVEQLRSVGLNFNKRIFNSKTNLETSVIKLLSTNLVSYKQAMRQGVRIGYQTFKAEPEHRILQCFKCQKSGHSAWNCIYEQVCLKCSGPHSHKECTTSELKCANCNQNHAACSRLCPNLQKLKAQSKQQIGANLKRPTESIQPKSTYANIVSQSHANNTAQPISNQFREQIQRMITTTIEAKLKELMVTLTDHITNLITNLINPQSVIVPTVITNPSNIPLAQVQTNSHKSNNNQASFTNSLANQCTPQLDNLSNMIKLLTEINTSFGTQKGPQQHNNNA